MDAIYHWPYLLLEGQRSHKNMLYSWLYSELKLNAGCSRASNALAWAVLTWSKVSTFCELINKNAWRKRRIENRDHGKETWESLLRFKGRCLSILYSWFLSSANCNQITPSSSLSQKVKLSFPLLFLLRTTHARDQPHPAALFGWHALCAEKLTSYYKRRTATPMLTLNLHCRTIVHADYDPSENLRLSFG